MGEDLRLLRVHLSHGWNDQPVPSYSLVAWVFFGFRGLHPARRRVVQGTSWPLGRRSTPAALRPALTAPCPPQEKVHVEDHQPHTLVQRRHQTYRKRQRGEAHYGLGFRRGEGKGTTTLPRDALSAGMNRNPDCWDNPAKFNPARQAALTKTKQRTFIPFGLGSRGCIGQHLAMTELASSLPVLARRGPSSSRAL